MAAAPTGLPGGSCYLPASSLILSSQLQVTCQGENSGRWGTSLKLGRGCFGAGTESNKRHRSDIPQSDTAPVSCMGSITLSDLANGLSHLERTDCRLSQRVHRSQAPAQEETWVFLSPISAYGNGC